MIIYVKDLTVRSITAGGGGAVHRKPIQGCSFILFVIETSRYDFQLIQQADYTSIVLRFVTETSAGYTFMAFISFSSK
jgi:hypothetical protein